VSRRRIGRLMEAEGLQVKTKRKFKATTYSDHDDPIAPNLLNRAFTVDKPDTCYVSDITYVATREGWIYLATVIDLYSRRVVGWSMADNMRTTLVNDALSMALNQRKPENGLLWHHQCSPISSTLGTNLATSALIKLLSDFPVIIAF